MHRAILPAHAGVIAVSMAVGSVPWVPWFRIHCLPGFVVLTSQKARAGWHARPAWRDTIID